MQFSNREIQLQNNSNVAAYVQARADVIREECEAEGSTFYMLPAVPAEGTYANVYEYERSMAFSAYSDTHKDAYGYRPRGDFSEWTLETIEQETEKLFDYMDLDESEPEVLEESILTKWDLDAIAAGYEV